jgi:flagellar motor protein MotB
MPTQRSQKGSFAVSVSQLGNRDLAEIGKVIVLAGKRASALALIVGLAACSTAPEWAKPDLIYGDDAAAASADPSSERDFPELADVPAKPTPPSTAAERRAAAEGLAADRQRARYTDEVLRGGTEAPAPAPRSASPAPAPVIATPPVAPAPVAAMPDEEAGIIPVPARGGRALPSSTATTAEVPQNRGAATQSVEVAPTVQPPAASSPVVQAPTPAAPAPVASAAPATRSAPAQPTRRPAVPALSESEKAARANADARAMANRTMIDDRVSDVNAASAAVQSAAAPVLTPAAATTTPRSNDRFEASTAPVLAQEALEAAGPVVSSRYGTPASAAIGSADPEDPVEVNLDALRGIPGPGAALQPSNGPGVTAAYAAQGGPGNIPPYVVNFGHGSVHLTADDRAKVALAAEAAQSHGGIVRVVGHASSRTGDLGVSRHVLANFKASLDRATSVADELIRNGVDPSRVFVEAKGDTVPVYYESMPAGEAGNRRAEIFIE